MAGRNSNPLSVLPDPGRFDGVSWPDGSQLPELPSSEEVRLDDRAWVATVTDGSIIDDDLVPPPTTAARRRYLARRRWRTAVSEGRPELLGGSSGTEPEGS